MDVDYILQAVRDRKNIIEGLEALRTVIIYPTEQEILDRQIEKEVAGLRNLEELLANTRQQ